MRRHRLVRLVHPAGLEARPVRYVRRARHPLRRRQIRKCIGTAVRDGFTYFLYDPSVLAPAKARSELYAEAMHEHVQVSLRVQPLVYWLGRYRAYRVTCCGQRP